MNKNILFIAYHFPPIGGSGVQRSLKYVKYLPEFNCNPIVVTVENGHNFAYDYSMLKEVPTNIKIYRSNSGEKLWLRNKIENLNKALVKVKGAIKLNSTEKVSDNQGKSEQSETIKDKVFRYLEYNHYIPDTKIRWYKHAVKDIKNRVLKENDIDIIYSTSAPYTDHLIGLHIKKITNKPWIADFRDPWIGNGAISDKYPKERIEKEKKMEREVVEFADIVINVTEPITEMYKKRYPEYSEKFVTITNGFDSKDKIEVEIVKSEKFEISYLGLLDSTRTPKSLILALEKLVKNNSELEKDLQVNFIGFVSDELKNMMAESSISKNIKIGNYIEHKDAIKVMANSSINLMILPDDEESKGVFTGKIFDYILAEKPILGIMPSDGVAANLINSNKIGLGVNHNEIDKICDFIINQYKLFKEDENTNTNAVVKCKEYDRINLTKKLVELVNQLVIK